MYILTLGYISYPQQFDLPGRSGRKRNHKLMCGSCLKAPILVSTRKLPLSTASPTWGACSNVWRRWRLLSPSTARVSWVTHERTGEMNNEVVKYTRLFFLSLSPCSILEEARVLLLSGEGQKDSPALRGGRPQRASQMAEERPGDQAISQVRAPMQWDPTLQHGTPVFLSFSIPKKSCSPKSQELGQRSATRKKLRVNKKWPVASAPLFFFTCKWVCIMRWTKCVIGSCFRIYNVKT